MTNTQVLFSILSSSVLAAFLTKSFDFWANNITYKRDYYKKIIDKRIAAYEQLEQVLHKFTGVVYDKINNRSFYECFRNYISFKAVTSELKSCADIQMWYSKKVNQALNESLTVMFNTAVNANFSTYNSDAQIQSAGAGVHIGLKKHLDDVYDCLIEDLKVLYDVPKFLGTQKK